jgi:hypothetical protein
VCARKREKERERERERDLIVEGKLFLWKPHFHSVSFSFLLFDVCGTHDYVAPKNAPRVKVLEKGNALQICSKSICEQQIEQRLRCCPFVLLLSTLTNWSTGYVVCNSDLFHGMLSD